MHCPICTMTLFVSLPEDVSEKRVSISSSPAKMITADQIEVKTLWEKAMLAEERPQQALKGSQAVERSRCLVASLELEVKRRRTYMLHIEHMSWH